MTMVDMIRVRDGAGCSGSGADRPAGATALSDRVRDCNPSRVSTAAAWVEWAEY
jgi:hypothetical protein